MQIYESIKKHIYFTWFCLLLQNLQLWRQYKSVSLRVWVILSMWKCQTLVYMPRVVLGHAFIFKLEYNVMTLTKLNNVTDICLFCSSSIFYDQQCNDIRCLQTVLFCNQEDFHPCNWNLMPTALYILSHCTSNCRIFVLLAFDRFLKSVLSRCFLISQCGHN